MYYSDYNRPPEQPELPALPEPIQAAPPARRRLWPAAVALVLSCALAGGSFGILGTILASRAGLARGSSTIYQGERTPTVVSVASMNTGDPLSLPEIYASNVGAVIGITVDIQTTNVFGQTVSQPAWGSGFVITSDGYILTNQHVVDSANKITVTFADDSTYDAVYISGDSDNDVAVLKIEAEGLTPVIIGDSDDMKVGEEVVAIGNPLGELTFSMTNGIISALNRSVTMSDGVIMNLMQTNTDINSGNSGGPLFNAYGEVIGITNAKYSSNGFSTGASIEGIGFAIPINDVIDMVKDIMEYGYIKGRPYLGISVSTAAESEARRYGRAGGAYVQSVTPGSCAEAAGLQVGDIITKIGEVDVTTQAVLINEKNQYKAGDTVTLIVDRNGQTMTLTVTFDEETPELTARTQQQSALVEPQQESNSGQSGDDYGGGWGFNPYIR